MLLLLLHHHLNHGARLSGILCRPAAAVEVVDRVSFLATCIAVGTCLVDIEVRSRGQASTLDLRSEELTERFVTHLLLDDHRRLVVFVGV